MSYPAVEELLEVGLYLVVWLLLVEAVPTPGGRHLESSRLLLLLGHHPHCPWTSLLRACHALDAYSRIYSVEVHPSHVLDLLVTDSALPDSVCWAVDMASAELASMESGPGERSSAAARRLIGRMGALIHYDWPDREDREDVLLQVRGYCWELHSLITEAYFDYPIEDVPLR